MKTNKEYKRLALGSLKGNWALCFLVFLVGQLLPFFADSGFLIALLVSIVSIIASAIVKILCLNIARGSSVDWGILKSWLPESFRLLLLSVRIGLECALFSLLLIFPGVMKAYSYAMVFFLYGDNPYLTNRQLLKESSRLMKGCRWRLFKLDFSFILWFLAAAALTTASVVTIAMKYAEPYGASGYNSVQQGILAIIGLSVVALLIDLAAALYYSFLGMYIEVSHAHFYESLTEQKEEEKPDTQQDKSSYTAVMPGYEPPGDDSSLS